ncbi:MAG TPA: dihydroorotate dehydrogenase [candidate division Zixibacteria bacterium]|nr:dihydroorotate dehydrogenase [candidate division Zixibacteria bacterium]
MSDLAVNIGNVRLKNPVMVASGCFGVGREYGELFDLSFLGGIVTKTVTLEPREGNLPPRVWETPAGMLNSIGLANPGISAFIETEIPFFRELDCAKIISIAGKNFGEFVEIIKKIDALDCIDAIEINVSCPNVEEGGLAFGTSPETVSGLVSTVRKITEKPLWVKLTPNVTDIAEIGRSAVDAGADALCAINTLSAMEIDIGRRVSRLGNITGGLSGAAIRPVALAKVFALHRALPDVPVVGIGGITEAGDAIAHMLAGASAVQVGSGIFRSPHLPIEVVVGIDQYCEFYDFPRAEDLTGALNIEE